MSTLKPNFYIGISTQNPPTIISIGRTIDGMEEIEVRLDQPDEDKLNIFKGKIEDIQTGEDYFKLADQDQIELDNDPTIQTINYPDNDPNLQVEESVVVPSQEAEAAKKAQEEVEAANWAQIELEKQIQERQNRIDLPHMAAEEGAKRMKKAEEKEAVGSGKKTKRRRNKRRLTKRRKTKRSKSKK